MREGIVSKSDLLHRRSESVDVPGIGMVNIRVMSARDRMELFKLAKAEEYGQFTARLIALTVCDVMGQPLLSEDEAGSVDHDIAEKIAAECIRINGLGKDGKETAIKNLASIPN